MEVLANYFETCVSFASCLMDTDVVFFMYVADRVWLIFICLGKKNVLVWYAAFFLFFILEGEYSSLALSSSSSYLVGPSTLIHFCSVTILSVLIYLQFFE